MTTEMMTGKSSKMTICSNSMDSARNNTLDSDLIEVLTGPVKNVQTNTLEESSEVVSRSYFTLEFLKHHIQETMPQITKGSGTFCRLRIETATVIVCVLELLAFTYLMSSSMMIYSNGPGLHGFMQPFLVHFWNSHPRLMISLNLGLGSVGVMVVACLLQALDAENAILVVPHLVFQVACILLFIAMSLVSAILLSAGTGALAIDYQHFNGTTIMTGSGHDVANSSEYVPDMNLILQKPRWDIVENEALNVPNYHSVLTALLISLTVTALESVFLIVVIRTYFHLKQSRN